MRLHFSDEDYHTPLVPPRFSRSATFCDERVTAEVKMSLPKLNIIV